MENSSLKSGWTKVRFRLNQKTIHSALTSPTKDPELSTLVKEVQRQVILYGEDYLRAQPGYKGRKTEIEELIAYSKKQGGQSQPDNGSDIIAERKFNRLVCKIYNYQTKLLVYEEKRQKLSLSTTRVRQRLCDLMGTDVIRLNDKRYFQKLSEKLQDEYETVMDKQEDARAASEHERIRRLMLEGVIDAPNDHRAIVYGDHNKRHGKKKRKKGKRQSSASGHSSATQSRLSDDEGIYKSRKEEVETQVGLQSSSRPSSTKSSLRGRTPDSRSQVKRVNIEEKENEVYTTSNELHARPPHHENALRSPDPTSDMKRGSRRVKSAAPRINRWEKDSVSSEHTDDDVTSQDGFDTQSLPDSTSMRKGSKFSRQEPERVSKLRTEETVAGLYSIAEEIVSPVRAEDQKYERKVVPVKKKMTISYS